MLGMDMPEAVAPGPYRVLARKYRPQKFSDLIGQDAMVQTLGNAIKRDRLAHAFLMTGVRGVGKTSTARLIAKGLNCIGPDGQGGPTIDPCGKCDPCVAIAEGRHIDVIEMDAASHTGVDDVREIIEAVRYAAVSARYKIYIIDEVHMLSKNAFNALLKTLEEPPAHVKFIFATTEVNKVPVTVLSRCQRFDLRRITPDLLFSHFEMICRAESVVAESAALQMIALAAEGSVRDGLSILDQAIAHAADDGEGGVTAAQVQAMLGRSDGGATRRLFASILAGDGATALAEARAQFALGVEPLAAVDGLMTLTHGIAMLRASGVDDPMASGEDRTMLRQWAGQLGMAQIQRLWQLLLRAHGEVAGAADPSAALDMALLRITHAATMPDPDELLRLLQGDGAADIPAATIPSASSVTASPAMASPATPAAVAQVAESPRGDGNSDDGNGANAAPPLSDEERTEAPTAPQQAEPPADHHLAEPHLPSLQMLVDALVAAGEQVAASTLRREGRLVAIAPNLLTLSRSATMDDGAAALMAAALGRATGHSWRVALSDQPGQPSLNENAEIQRQQRAHDVRSDPIVKSALATFPNARILGEDGARPAQ